jgi:hypothetical protein
MAPTTLLGQLTTTTPTGRTPFAGQPLKVAEMIAGLDGPVFVERVALYDNRSARTPSGDQEGPRAPGRGHRASRSIEVLAECPIHLKLEPEEAEAWVRDEHGTGLPAGREEGRRRRRRFPPIPRPSFDPRAHAGRRSRRRPTVPTTSRPPSRRTSIRKTSASSSPAPAGTVHRRRDAHHPRRHRRGLRLDPHPELRTGVARRHVVRRRARRDQGGALPGGAGPARAGGVQRSRASPSSAPPCVRAASSSTTAR